MPGRIHWLDPAFTSISSTVCELTRLAGSQHNIHHSTDCHQQ